MPELKRKRLHKSTFRLWADSFKDDKELWMLEDAGDDSETGLFMSKTRYQYLERDPDRRLRFPGTPDLRDFAGYNVQYSTPVYHVWIDGKWVLATENYQEACDTYHNKLKERR